jgi:hypothetical protein
LLGLLLSLLLLFLRFLPSGSPSFTLGTPLGTSAARHQTSKIAVSRIVEEVPVGD